MQPITLYAHAKVYRAFFIIWGGLAAVAVGMTFVHSSFLEFAIVFSIVLMASLLWLRSFKVTLSNDGISKSTMFRQPHWIAWSAIHNAEIRMGYSGSYELRDALRAPYRLVIEPHWSASSSPIVINLKLLSQEDADRLVQMLNSKLPGGKLRA